MSTPRLQQRCLVTSAVAHGVLVAVLVLAPAFQRPKDELLLDGSPLELIPGSLLDAALAAPLAAAAAAAPEIVAPQPEPEPEPLPPPPTPAPREVTPPPPKPQPKPEPVPVTPPPQPAPRETPREEPKPVKPKPKPAPRETPAFDFSKATPVQPKENPAARAKAEAEARARDLQRQLDRAAGAVRTASRGPTTVSISGGGGGGSANARHVRAAYDVAWIIPSGVRDSSATTEVEVVIRGDGTVARSRIVSRSGIAALDKSVEEALRKVTRIRPFETFSPDEQITFTIGFNLQAKNLF